MAGTPKKRAKREAAAKAAAAGDGSAPGPAEDLETRVRRADLEAQVRGIAEAAKAEEAKIRGPGAFKPRHDLAVKGLPQAGPGGEAPAGVDTASGRKAMAILGRNLELAFLLTTDWMAELLELERRPDKAQVKDVAEAWGLVLETYGERLLQREPELGVALAVTGVTYLPMAVEVWARSRALEREAGRTAVQTAAEVAADE